MREYIIDTVGEIGGHFGANLGTCELAVALHSLLDSPRDKILWDVGHQAYPHKVLTGRRDELPTIRSYGGLAPFCSREESVHDIMGAGHASTAASYAVGIKEAMRKRRELGIAAETDEPEPSVVAVVGDGAMTGGVNFEALLNAGGLETPIVIVLNDNGMSISPNVGALSRYFNRLRLNPQGLPGARGGRGRAHAGCPPASARRIERLGPQLKESIKAFWAPGPVLRGARPRLRRRDRRPRREGAAARAAPGAERRTGPVVVHIKTVKGKGFAPAEEGGLEGMEKWHAAKPKSIENGRVAAAKKPDREGAAEPRRSTRRCSAARSSRRRAATRA